MRVKIELNKDQKAVDEVRRALAANEGYCPCKLIHSPDTKCMCREFREQQSGSCHCGLYNKIVVEVDK